MTAPVVVTQPFVDFVRKQVEVLEAERDALVDERAALLLDVGNWTRLRAYIRARAENRRELQKLRRWAVMP